MGHKTRTIYGEELMDKDKKLKLMNFWIFGSYVIVWASSTIYIGSVVGTSTAIFGEMRYWITIIISALLCVVWAYGYKKYLDRKD
jgi:membrane protein DedA with SNARE-associated domain